MAAPPRQSTPFLGREHELRAIQHLVNDVDTRLLTLTGPGGVGKTRIAIEIAARLESAFPDGIAFVSLGSTNDPERVPILIAQATGVPDDAGRSLAERLQLHLSERAMLLVLDNLEHLPGAFAHVANLLAVTSHLKVLCTSRSGLGLSAEQVYPVPAMTPAEARSLFERRARAADPNLDMDPSNPIIDQICARLDYLPLAIELAAARVSVLTPHALLAQLERQLPVLVGGPRDVPARQRTMRDTITWSHTLLDEDEQRFFRQLAVFAGGFSLAAAESVAESPAGALDALSRLVASGLAWRTPGPRGDPRFRLPSTIREFAWEQLVEQDEADALRTTHARYYMGLAEAALPHYDGPELPVYKDRIEAELDNCRAAMAWSLESGDGEAAIRLSGALWRIWWPAHVIGGKVWSERIEEGLSWINRALVHREGVALTGVTEALIGGAALNTMLRRLPEAREFDLDLLRLSQEQHYSYGEYWANFQLGNIALEGGIWKGVGHDEPPPEPALRARARNFLERALEVAPGMRNPENHQAMALGCLADVARASGNDEEALDLVETGLGLARQCGNPHCISWLGLVAGRLSLKLGNPWGAIRDLSDSTIANASISDHGGVRASITELGRVALSLGQPESAARFLLAVHDLPAHEHDRSVHDAAVAESGQRLGKATLDRLQGSDTPPSIDDLLDLARSLDEPGSVDPERSQGPFAALTAREGDVLRLIAEGCSNREISDRLSISPRTVENHVLHILTKLNVPSRTAAATMAVRDGRA